MSTRSLLRGALRRSRTSALAIVLASFVAACGGPPPAPVTPVEEAPKGLVITETAPQPWKTYTDALGGFSVAMPSEPKILSGELGKAGGEVRSFVISDGDPRTADYEVARFFSGGAQGPADPSAFVDVITKGWKKGLRREKRERHGIKTIELAGETPEGKIAMSVTSAGTFLYVLTVTSTEAIDADLAERFFDSLRLEMPWRIETFPADAFTLALPAAIAETPVAPRENAEIHVYFLKAESELWVGVTLFSLTDERVRTASLDDILDDGVRGLARGAGVTIDKVVPYEHHGLHGREVLHTAGNGQAFRSRMFVVGHRGYHVSVSSKNRALISEDTALRILDSMRIGATP